jgi:hypothetical protein
MFPQSVSGRSGITYAGLGQEGFCYAHQSLGGIIVIEFECNIVRQVATIGILVKSDDKQIAASNKVRSVLRPPLTLDSRPRNGRRHLTRSTRGSSTSTDRGGEVPGRHRRK